MMSRRETKFEEITVTGQSMNPRNPTITLTDITQQDVGRSTHRSFRKK